MVVNGLRETSERAIHNRNHADHVKPITGTFLVVLASLKFTILIKQLRRL
jgi:hypothetical protein